MSRRRSNPSFAAGQGQDPGKDLFAYLFLLMMVFVFVLLMTLHQVQAEADMTTAPKTAQPQGSSTLKNLKQNQFGTLVKEDGQLVLRFGNESFNPQQDLERLLASSYLITDQDDAGQARKTLYLDAAQQQTVLLGEYLTSFQALNRAGISVAFAERVEK